MSRVPGLLNNPTMQNIDEPVALYFSYVDVNDIEDVLIEPPSQIRKDFSRQRKAFEMTANKFREILNETTPDAKTQNTNGTTTKVTFNNNNNHR